MLINKIKTSPLALLCGFILVLSSCSKPMASFMLSDEEIKAPASITFENKSTKAESYLWDFGDGTTSTEVSPDHKYILSGNYKVTLKATKGKKESIIEQTILVNPPQDCLVEMETSKGTMTILLYDKTPLHRDNFIKLAETGYYDGLLFHRVINSFMAQGGDPKSKGAAKNVRLGSGGPGYQVPAEFDKTLHHIKGALAAARTGGPGNPEKKSSGSQFYIVHGKKYNANQLDILEAQKNIKYSEEDRKVLTEQGGTPQLDQEYTVYGRVIKGLDVLDQIAETPTGTADRPVEDVVILKVRAVK
jgi:peptidyl-prolyl cis-trans isomerase B (cyclophilin B)